MPINPSIVLAGQQPDYVNILARANQAAAGRNQLQQQQQLQNLYRDQGAGILAGEQGALNALAGYDPAAALGIQGQQQQQQFATRQQERLDAAERRQIESHYAGLGARQREQEAQQIEQGILSASQFYHNGDLNSLNQALQQYGEQPLQSLDQFPGVASRYGDVLDTIRSVRDFGAPPKAADEYGRYVQEERAAGRDPLSRLEYKRAGQARSRISVSPDGSVSIVEGGGDDAPDLTVDAAKNTGFLIRMQDSGQTLDQLEQEGLSLAGRAAGAVPFDLGNYLVSENYQQFDQAKRDFVNAILRRESGAVISDSEFANADKQYFPVPGDSQEVIAQKRANRANALQGVRAGAGAGGAYADALREGAEPAEDAAREPQIPDFRAMSDEELDAYIAQAGGT